jgi:pimeloyl-ACP methyl ester carboxylesterase
MQSENESSPKLGYREVYFSATDGLRLYARIYGDGKSTNSGATPVVCLPGLTRNSADFHQLAINLSSDETAPRRVVCFDCRGRGHSQWDNNKANYIIQVEADDVLSGCAALGIKHGVFVGTSRGVLIIHALAAIRPGILVAAVLNDAGPVVEGAGLAQIMAYQDRMTAPKSIEEAAAMLRQTQGKAFTALSDEDWMDYVRPMFVQKAGKLDRNFDPAIVEMLREIDLNAPLPTLWPQFEGLRNIPLLTIRGKNSSLLSAETVAEMTSRHPGMEAVTAMGQGHAPVLHLGDLPKTIGSFVRKTDRR